MIGLEARFYGCTKWPKHQKSVRLGVGTKFFHNERLDIEPSGKFGAGSSVGQNKALTQTFATLHSSLELGRLGRPRDGPHTTDVQCSCSLGRRDGLFTPRPAKGNFESLFRPPSADYVAHSYESNPTKP